MLSSARKEQTIRTFYQESQIGSSERSQHTDLRTRMQRQRLLRIVRTRLLREDLLNSITGQESPFGESAGTQR